MAFGRSFRDNPAAWIALGVVGILALAPVRRALRAATVSAAVGVLKLGDGLVQAGGRVTEESKAILADASGKRDEWRQKSDHGSGESWLRKTVVTGLASTLGAADQLTQGARQTFFRDRSATQTEVGEIGEVESDDFSGETWTAVQTQERKELPEHLLPKPFGEVSQHGHTGRHVPGDFAVRSPDAMMRFAQAVHEVGAGLKPEYQELLETVATTEK